MPRQAQTYLIALGGNMPSSYGPAELTLRRAVERLREHGLEITAISRFYETPCFPAGAGPDYVNAAAALRSALDPAALLTVLHDIEAEFGRAREQRWGMRCLDLDIIAQDSLVLPDLPTYQHWQSLPPDAQRSEAPSTLILPHPRLAERAFVLVPLADIAPDWRHPVTCQTTAEMLKALPEAEKEAISAL